MANYNNARYLRECLDSVLGQTFSDLEIVVCDDCSTDASLEVLEEYRQRYQPTIRVLQNQRNRGVTPSRHRAIEQAAGEYVTTLDSDDFYVSPVKLESEMALLRQHREPGDRPIIAFSNIRYVAADGSLLYDWGSPENIREGRIFHELLSRACMVPRDFVFSRDLYFEIGGFDSEIPLYEDWDLKLRLATGCDYRYSGETGTAYRRHEGGLSSAPKAEHLRWLRHVFAKNLPQADPAERDRVFRGFLQYLEQA